jgi:16S rRNA processing protein RimM
VSDESDFVLIGLLRRAHGVKGEVCVEPVSDIVERFDALDYVLVKQGKTTNEVGVDSVRWKGKLALLKLDGIDDRTSAETLRGAMLGVRREDVFPVPEDTYYVFDMIGCRVIGTGGREIGTVDDVLKMPANDVLVLRRDKGEALIPFIKSVISSVDLKHKLIAINEIEGLLD